ncbi:uncharacterized protein [Arachis hypogaea]|uniref:uncharacterized protein n=1 Tax=Arachis hypogaea TaxID=3818 RepID=UPI0007AFA8D8
MPSPLSFRLSETVTELLAAGSYRRSCGCPTAASAAGNRRFSEFSIGTAVLTTVDEAHRSCSKVIATLFGSIGRCTVAGVVAENCRGNPCLLVVYARDCLSRVALLYVAVGATIPLLPSLL